MRRDWAGCPRAASARRRPRTPPARLPRRDRCHAGSRRGWRGRAPTPRGTPARAGLALRQRAHLDRAAQPRDRDPRGDLQRLVEILRLEDAEAAHVLLRIDERAVGEQRLPVLDAHRRRGLDRLQPRGADDPRQSLEDAELLANRLLLIVGQLLERIDHPRRVDLEQVPHRVPPSCACSRSSDERDPREGTPRLEHRLVAAGRCPLRRLLFVASQESTPKTEAPMSNNERRKWLVLAVTVAAQFMVIVDVSVVNVALPAIKHDLHFSQDNLQWVVTAYALLFGGALLLGGRLADLLGRRRMFMAGVAVFTLGSLLSGLAWSEGALIATRALQGLGGALLAPAALSIVVTSFREGRERNIALGVWGAASGSGGAVGVLLGGVLTSYLSWSWIFFVNLPVGIAVLAVSPWLLRESRAELAHRHFDVAGATSITAGLMVLVYAITRTSEHGWSDGLTLGLLAVAAALVAAFAGIESRSP